MDKTQSATRIGGEDADFLAASDIRKSAAYQELDAFYRTVRKPGSGLISDAADLSVGGGLVGFTASLVNESDATATTRIGLTDLASGSTKIATFGPHNDRAPKFSPDGRSIAFLSDRGKPGTFQLYLLDLANGETHPASAVDGNIESLHWSPDGTRILLGVAEHGAHASGAQRATAQQVRDSAESWMPSVAVGDDAAWRRAWIYDVEADAARCVSPPDLNVWEVCWAGNQAIAAIVSDAPSEGDWYTARVRMLELQSGASRELARPSAQVGWLAGSPSGQHLAYVEALCSDRWVVAGELCVVDLHDGKTFRVDTNEVDVACVEWRDDRRLLVAGHRRFETVAGVLDLDARSFQETWSSEALTTNGFYAKIAGHGVDGDFVLAAESFDRAPELALVRGGVYTAIQSFDHRPSAERHIVSHVERVTWTAPDGLAIEGWLLLPDGEAPFPLIMNVHGGPVSHWRPLWLGRRSAHILLLVQRGYAVFLPNPRGSAGRGRDFASLVVGDMGGDDSKDLLSGLDHLVAQNIADPDRLGVTGGSYGGYMTAWLICQDHRFSAAAAIAPVTNHVTEHLASNIPHFVQHFLADTYKNLDGAYYHRSPILYADKVRTPLLIVCGALDKCTPPTEGLQFHNALLENGQHSVLVNYPKEGHGVRQFPAVIDFGARMLSWFEQHLRRANSTTH